MKIKNLLTAATLLALLTAAGCNEDDPSSKDPIDQLPPPTQEGKNTFGCLVNGEAWVTKTSIDASSFYQGNILFISAGVTEREREQDISFTIEDEFLSTGTYNLKSSNRMKGLLYNQTENCDYKTFDPQSGELTISLLDFNKFIIAGSFEFEAVSVDCQDTVRVTEGRFDLNFIP